MAKPPLLKDHQRDRQWRKKNNHRRDGLALERTLISNHPRKRLSPQKRRKAQGSGINGSRRKIMSRSHRVKLKRPSSRRSLALRAWVHHSEMVTMQLIAIGRCSMTHSLIDQRCQLKPRVNHQRKRRYTSQRNLQKETRSQQKKNLGCKLWRIKSCYSKTTKKSWGNPSQSSHTKNISWCQGLRSSYKSPNWLLRIEKLNLRG